MTVPELQLARNDWMRALQVQCYSRELILMTRSGGVTQSSSLQSLHPVLGADGLIKLHRRVYGKLTVIRSTHLRLQHAGATDTLTELRELVWITAGER